MGTAINFKGRSITMSGPLAEDEMQMLRAEVREGLGKITEIDVEFLSDKTTTALEDVLGEYVSISIEYDDSGTKRHFGAHCIEVVYEGIYQGMSHFTASLRAWPWFLTQTQDCRIFQEKSAMDIIKQIFGDHGFSDYEDKTNGSFSTRTYCVQYRETDWDFVYRLMVEEGIYFYFDYTTSIAKLVMVDSSGSHSNIEGTSTVDFFFKEDGYRRRDDHIFEWRHRETLRSGKVTMNDYFYETSQTDLKAVSAIPKGKHSHKNYEVYDYHGRYTDTGRGETLARHWMESMAAEHKRARGIANVRTLACGYRFTMQRHPREATNIEYLITEAIHQLQIETDYNLGELEETSMGERVVLDWKKFPDPYRCTFRAMPSTEEFKLPRPFPKPKIMSMQTALVVGPSGEEIYTDEYGRVKLHFYWDREGQKNENSSCWVRKAEPWSGKGWGMVWVPRIGQEVVVQFEEGDPDRPLIVGMLFNDQTKHPFTLDANKTRMGWTTISSKGGTAGGYEKTSSLSHEFIFEDKKDSEFVRLQSERDYFERIKNNATITVGMEHQDEGNYDMTIYNHRTEVVKQGNHTFTVEVGTETYTVEDDRTVTMNNNHIEEVANDQTSTIGANQTVDIGSNQDVTVGSNQTIDVGQNITITAGTKITLKVGSTSIVMDSMGITMKGTNIKSEATMNFEASGGMKAAMTSDMQAEVTGSLQATFGSDLMTELKGLMTTVKGDAMLTVKGGITMIN